MTPLLALEELGEAQEAHLLSVAGQPALRGGHCASCGRRFFPLKQLCPHCSAALSVIALPTQGRLYAYTTVHVSQSRPTPYRIGYVDLDGDVRVLASVLGAEHELRIDAPVRLVATTDGAWAFEPMTRMEEPAHE